MAASFLPLLSDKILYQLVVPRIVIIHSTKSAWWSEELDLDWIDFTFPPEPRRRVAMTIFKFFALLVLNVVVMTAIRRQQMSHIGKMRAGQQSNSNRKYRNSNIILMSSVLLYLVCRFPGLMVELLKISDDVYHQYNFRKTHRKFTIPFVQVAFLTNYSVNFFLYLTASKKFRTQCKQLFAPCCCKFLLLRKQHSATSRSTGSTRCDASDGDEDEPQEVHLSSIESNKVLYNGTELEQNGRNAEHDGTKWAQA
ncbi:hypothetical protein BV898_09222 [Hypsibius exemplaris]|uniref:G-protein coupled receptors family 1 profile domain-containing protein n=1 Tax=Hypsibius exemplaris TaxID=2072580 RepID=A0A1W0WNC4_HYPEX|nr:hypothetical protein BV898_09222 [Hypsibius exemplaris]